MDGKRGWWVVFGAAWTLTITAGVGFFSMAVLAEAIMADTGWTEQQYTNGIAIWGLTAALFSPFCGLAIDKFGSRPVMIIGILVAAAAEFTLGRVTELSQFYAVLIVLAMGVMATTYIPVAAIVSHWFVQRIGIATGLSMLGLGIGGGLFPQIAGALVSEGSYQSAFAILAGILLTALIPVFIGLRPPNEQERAQSVTDNEHFETYDPQHDLTLKQALRSRSFWGLSIGDLLTGLIFAIFNTLLVLYITEDTGDSKYATLVFSILSFGLGFGILVFGPLGEMFNFRRVFVLCYFLPSVGTVLLAISSAPLTAISFAVIAGFAGGGRSALFPAALLKSFGGTHMGAIYGVSNTLFMLGTAAGPAIASAIHEETGSTRPVYALAVGVFIVSTFLISLIRDERVSATE